MTIPPPPGLARHRANRALLAAGLLQLAAVLTPAVQARIVGTIPFFRLPNAGLVLVGLGLLTVGVAFRPRGWWRWVPGTLSGVIVAVAYFRIVRAPSGRFFDPVLRHAVHPGWGFVPMSAAILLGLVGAAFVRRVQPTEAPLGVYDFSPLDSPLDE